MDTRRVFERVFVRPPSDDYVDCHSTDTSHKEIDLGLSRRQHRDYVSILKESGIDVVELPKLNGFPDSVFVQDPAVLGLGVTIVGRFSLRSRVGEETALVNNLSSGNRRTGSLRFIEGLGRLEGGDVLVTEAVIFVGISSRTNLEGIRQLTAHLSGLRVVPVKTRSFHLLCGCSYIGKNTIAIAPSMVNADSFAGFKLIEVPEEEAYAANLLSLDDDRVLIPSGYPRVRGKLRSAGFRPVEIENSEFRKGDGGLTCLSCPAYNTF